MFTQIMGVLLYAAIAQSACANSYGASALSFEANLLQGFISYPDIWESYDPVLQFTTDATISVTVIKATFSEDVGFTTSAGEEILFPASDIADNSCVPDGSTVEVNIPAGDSFRLAFGGVESTPVIFGRVLTGYYGHGDTVGYIFAAGRGGYGAVALFVQVTTGEVDTTGIPLVTLAGDSVDMTVRTMSQEDLIWVTPTENGEAGPMRYAALDGVDPWTMTAQCPRGIWKVPEGWERAVDTPTTRQRVSKYPWGVGNIVLRAPDSEQPVFLDTGLDGGGMRRGKPVVTDDECSGKFMEVQADQVEWVPEYVSSTTSGGKTTYSYKVKYIMPAELKCSKNGNMQGLSHWVLGLCNDIVDSSSPSSFPNDFGVDPTTNTLGYKWDIAEGFGPDVGEIAFSVTVNGVYELGMIEYSVKGATRFARGQVAGPIMDGCGTTEGGNVLINPPEVSKDDDAMPIIEVDEDGGIWVRGCYRVIIQQPNPDMTLGDTIDNADYEVPEEPSTTGTTTGTTTTGDSTPSGDCDLAASWLPFGDCGYCRDTSAGSKSKTGKFTEYLPTEVEWVPEFVRATEADGETTYCYNVKYILPANRKKMQQLSHWVLGVCLDGEEAKADPTTGVYGYKWDFGYAVGDNDSEFCLTVPGTGLAMGEVAFAVKGATRYAKGTITGPYVGEGCPGASPAGTALCVSTCDAGNSGGAFQRLGGSAGMTNGVTIGAWSKATDVSPFLSMEYLESDYSIYVDVFFVDGSTSLGHFAGFSEGTHGWEYREVTVQASQIDGHVVDYMDVYLLFRNRFGSACFSDVVLPEVEHNECQNPSFNDCEFAWYEMEGQPEDVVFCPDDSPNCNVDDFTSDCKSMCLTADEHGPGSYGMQQFVTFTDEEVAAQDFSSIVISGACKSDGVSCSGEDCLDEDYSIFFDVRFADCVPDEEAGEDCFIWANSLPCDASSELWASHQRTIEIPEGQKIKEVWVTALFRDRTGTGCFDNVGVDFILRNETALTLTHGDPHMITLDGLNYDLQSVGEYVLTRDDRMEVQTRHAPAGGAAVTAAVAIKIDGSTFSVQRGEGANAPKVYVNGGELMVPKGGAALFGDSEALAIGQLEVHGSMRAPVLGNELMGSKYVFSFPGTGHRVVVTAFLSGSTSGEQYFKVIVNLPTSGAKTAVGLLGNLDRDQSNDITDAEGNVLTTSFNDIYTKFAPSWKVTDESSAFFYGPGESTATFTDDSFFAEERTFTEAEQAVAEEACRRVVPELRAACTYDVLYTAEQSYSLAYSSLTSVVPRRRSTVAHYAPATAPKKAQEETAEPLQSQPSNGRYASRVVLAGALALGTLGIAAIGVVVALRVRKTGRDEEVAIDSNLAKYDLDGDNRANMEGSLPLVEEEQIVDGDLEEAYGAASRASYSEDTDEADDTTAARV